MSTLEISILGLALATDAFSVTISNSFLYQHESRVRMMLMPIFFGIFQFAMPLAGYVAGGLAAQIIEQYADIVTFLILGFIGGNMVYSGYMALRDNADNEEDQTGRKALTIPILILQAIATAIDAFAVGVSFRAQTTNILGASCVIGLITFVVCLVALFIGKKLGSILGDRAEMVGGFVLIAIGLKAFLQ